MKILAAILLLLLPSQVRCQWESEERPEVPDLSGGEAVPPVPSGPPSPVLDSLYRRLASLEVEQAREEVASSGFWHRLIPAVTLGAGLGVRDLAFPDAAGALLLPKDSYRLNVALSLSALLDGSERTRAEFRLAETETRYMILVRRQSLARITFERRRSELAAELAALRDELPVRSSALAYQELLFSQGRADFHAVAGARIDLIRLRHAVSRLELRIHELERSSPGEHPG